MVLLVSQILPTKLTKLFSCIVFSPFKGNEDGQNHLQDSECRGDPEDGVLLQVHANFSHFVSLPGPQFWWGYRRGLLLVPEEGDPSQTLQHDDGAGGRSLIIRTFCVLPLLILLFIHFKESFK